MTRALLLLFTAILLCTAPAFAAGPSLLGVNSEAVSAPATTAPAAPVLGGGAPRSAAPPKEESWLSRFGSGFVDGVVNAIPNMWKAIKEGNLTTLAVVGGMVALAVAAPAVAAVAGVAFTVGAIGYTAVASGGDPTKIGQVVGETAFWGVAGLGIARGATALRGGTAAAETAAVRAATAEGTAARVATAETTLARAATTEGTIARAATTEGTIARTASTADTSLPVLNNPLCFVAGTPVLTASGTRAIESLSAADEVITWAPRGRHSAATIVTGALFAMLAGSPVDASVASDALPAASLPRWSTYAPNGVALGERSEEALTPGVLVRMRDRLWKVAGRQRSGVTLEATDLGVRRVVRTFANPTREVYDLTAVRAGGRFVRVTGTAEHPFLAGGAWTKLAALTPGTPIATSDGVAVVFSVARRTAPQRVFNFEVEDTHCYYVDGLLAHNICTGDKLVNASSGVRTALAENPTAAISKVDDVATATTAARDRVATLLRDARTNNATAGGNANEIRGVATGAERSAADLRAVAAESRAANPDLAAKLEAEAARLERLATQSRNAAATLDQRAAGLSDAQRIAEQSKLVDEAVAADRAAMQDLIGKKPSVSAGAIDEFGNRVIVGRSQVGAPRNLSAAKTPELAALEPRLLQLQASMIKKELDAIRTLPRDQQLRFLRSTLQQELQAAKVPRPDIQARVQNYGRSLDTMSDAQLQAELTARYAALDALPQQTQAEFVANAFAGKRLTAIRPGNCAEWSALDEALAARGQPLPNPPGQGLSIKALDANGIYKPCCPYCQFLAEQLGVRVIR